MFRKLQELSNYVMKTWKKSLFVVLIFGCLLSFHKISLHVPTLCYRLCGFIVHKESKGLVIATGQMVEYFRFKI